MVVDRLSKRPLVSLSMVVDPLPCLHDDLGRRHAAGPGQGCLNALDLPVPGCLNDLSGGRRVVVLYHVLATKCRGHWEGIR